MWYWNREAVNKVEYTTWEDNMAKDEILGNTLKKKGNLEPKTQHSQKKKKKKKGNLEIIRTISSPPHLDPMASLLHSLTSCFGSHTTCSPGETTFSPYLLNFH